MLVVFNVLNFGCFPGVWFILADVSEHSICSIFKADDLEVFVFSMKLFISPIIVHCCITNLEKWVIVYLLCSINYDIKISKVFICSLTYVATVGSICFKYEVTYQSHYSTLLHYKLTADCVLWSLSFHTVRGIIFQKSVTEVSNTFTNVKTDVTTSVTWMTTFPVVKLTYKFMIISLRIRLSDNP
jgi:hypothetical protein